MKEFKEFAVQASPYGCDYLIKGDDLIVAIELNFGRIAKNAYIGNAAGYRLLAVGLKYNASILGGKGGAELSIESEGLDLAHRKTNSPHSTKKVWIYADKADVPDHVFNLTL